MKNIFLSLSLIAIAFTSFAQEIVYVHDTVYIANSVFKEQVEASVAAEAAAPAKNNWGAKLKASNFHVGLDIQTKYMWRGIEMMSGTVHKTFDTKGKLISSTEEGTSAPVLFPSLNFQWNGLFVYAMGGYAVNGKYSELDFGVSYTWKGLTFGFNDYFYPETYGAYDGYFKGGEYSKHWLEACVSYAPEKAPVWVTVSNFFYAPSDIWINEKGNEKRAYSTYFELGAYYDFLQSNRISLAVGMTPARSWYNSYQNKFSVCNIDLKYTYNIKFNSGWILPLSAELVYNPVYDKPFFNFITNFAF